MDIDWYKENKALQAELRREYPAVAELIAELESRLAHKQEQCDQLAHEVLELEQQLADEKKAAGHWMEQSCKDHNRAEKAEAQLSRYQGAVEVEGQVTMMENGLSVPGLNAVLAKFPYRVRVLVMKEVE